MMVRMKFSPKVIHVLLLCPIKYLIFYQFNQVKVISTTFVELSLSKLLSEVIYQISWNDI